MLLLLLRLLFFLNVLVVFVFDKDVCWWEVDTHAKIPVTFFGEVCETFGILVSLGGEYILYPEPQEV